MNEGICIKGEVTVVLKKLDGSEEIICKDNSNLLTYAGRDWIHSQIYNTGTLFAGRYIALSCDTVAPNVHDTTLTSEIIADGLERAISVVTHTVETNITTITRTFTATAFFTAVQKTGLFTASSGGTLLHENSFTGVNMAPGEQLSITWRITAG